MIRKSKLFPIVIITIILLTFYLYKNDREIKKAHFSELTSCKETIGSICNIKKKSDASLLKTLCFNNNELFFDANNSCFYYSLIDGDSEANNPLIEWNDKKINILFDDVKITDELISKNIKINFIAYNDNYYFEYTLVCTTLPLLNINTSEKLCIVDDMAVFSKRYNNYDMSLILFDNSKNVEQRLYNYSGQINVRGNDTTKYDKKGFAITIFSKEVESQKQEQVSLLGLRYGNKYILYAGYNDAEKIRNVFSSKLWYDSCAYNNMFSLSNGMYYEYIELFINSEYYGLYAMGFPIDEIQEQITIDSNSKYQIENIYKKDSNSCEYDFDFLHPDENGYVIASNNGKGSFEPLVQYYGALLNNDVEKLLGFADIDNSIDFYLFNNLIQNVDCVKYGMFEKQSLYNFYLTSKNNNGRIAMLYCPWDLDRTWGYGFGEINYNIPYDSNCEMEYNIVYLLLNNNDSEIKERIKKRYFYLRNNNWSNNNILAILNKYEDDIFNSGAYLRDENRWPNGLYSSEGIELSVFKEYVVNRLEYFDDYITDLVQ